MISPDGLWVLFVVQQGDDEATKALHAFSTTGASPPRVLGACPVSRAADGGAGPCRPYGWAGDSTLLVERGGRALEAWGLATDSRVSFEDVTPDRTMPSKSSVVLVEHRGSTARSLLDVRDPVRPVLSPVPTTELTSFKRVHASPDGRWLLLSHADGESGPGRLVTIDLHATGPLSAREILRDDRSDLRGFSWSTSGTTLVVHRAGSGEVARGTRIELATGHAVPVDVALPRRKTGDSPFLWEWRSRLGPDDNTLAIPRGDTLAIWQMGRPEETAVALDGVPATSWVLWLPSR